LPGRERRARLLFRDSRANPEQANVGSFWGVKKSHHHTRKRGGGRIYVPGERPVRRGRYSEAFLEKGEERRILLLEKKIEGGNLTSEEIGSIKPGG